MRYCDASNVLLKLDTLYKIFKQISIKFSSKIEKQRNEKLNFLNLLIKASESKNKIVNTEYFNRLLNERDEILTHKYRGANIRSRIPVLLTIFAVLTHLLNCTDQKSISAHLLAM